MLSALFIDKTQLELYIIEKVVLLAEFSKFCAVVTEKHEKRF